MSKQNRRRKKKIRNAPQATSQLVLSKISLENCGDEFQAAAARIMARSQKLIQEKAKAQVQQAVFSSVQPSLPQSEIVSDDSKEVKEVKLAPVFHLPAKRSDDDLLRLEQNFGCEFPVCVANRRDVNKDAIEISVDGDAVWRLERTASGLLAAPEHHPIWLWLLDRFQAACQQGCVEAPRIPINLPQLAKDLGRTPNGQWYKDVDEALSRFAGSVIMAGKSLYLADRGQFVSQRGAFGTLCNYVSWRTQSSTERQSLVDGISGWVQPGPFVWESICSGYLKAVPLLAMRNLQSYVAQRLYLHLSKHCQPGGCYKVSFSKLLPKIPMSFSKNSKEKLKPHHKALLESGFLASGPIYEGRGARLMVTYERAVG